MKVKLSQDDRCAIDLVMEQRAAGDEAPASCLGRSSASLQKRVKRVEKVFDLIGLLPAEEPSTGLVKLTMRHIRQHEHDAVSVAGGAGKGVTMSGLSHRPLQ